MKYLLGLAAIAALSCAAPAAATTFSGTLVPSDSGYAELVFTPPDLTLGTTTHVSFSYSGGVAEGNAFSWEMMFTDDNNDDFGSVGCSFPVGTHLGGCSSSVPGVTITGSVQLGQVDAWITVPDCPRNQFDVCGLGYATDRSGSYFDFTVSGAPTTYLLTISAVPEPATWIMMLLGFGIIGATRVRRGGVQQSAARAS